MLCLRRLVGEGVVIGGRDLIYLVGKGAGVVHLELYAPAGRLSRSLPLGCSWRAMPGVTVEYLANAGVDAVRLGFGATRDVPVDRLETWAAKVLGVPLPARMAAG